MKRILIVEDNVGVGHVIAACLASYDVTVTHNGPEALARASQLSACDLLITDYLMPSMTGEELIGHSDEERRLGERFVLFLTQLARQPGFGGREVLGIPNVVD